jgi:hypothetical protein
MVHRREVGHLFDHDAVAIQKNSRLAQRTLRAAAATSPAARPRRQR